MRGRNLVFFKCKLAFLQVGIDFLNLIWVLLLGTILLSQIIRWCGLSIYKIMHGVWFYWEFFFEVMM